MNSRVDTLSGMEQQDSRLIEREGWSALIRETCVFQVQMYAAGHDNTLIFALGQNDRLFKCAS